MTVVRSIAAVLLGVLLASIVAATALLAPTANLHDPQPGLVGTWITLVAAAALLSAPNWLLVSIVVVPVLMHRAANHPAVPISTYLFWALVIGGLSMLPTVLLLGADGLFVVILLSAGVIGALSIALLLRRFVLAPRGRHLSPSLPGPPPQRRREKKEEDA